MKKFISNLSIMIVVAILSACNSAPKVDDATLAGKNTAPVSAVAQVVVPAHLDPNSALSKNRSVYFDFDDFTVKKEYASLVENHGKYAGANSKLTVRVEGNADERGGREYNLALGQKRAEAVVRAMKVYGAKDGQVEPVSYGSEKPKAQGHDETAWAQNRRADVVYMTK